jgi:hypothetical protein
MRGIDQSQAGDDAVSCEEQTTFARNEIPMHDFAVASVFVLMVILPCIVTMGQTTAQGRDDA